MTTRKPRPPQGPLQRLSAAQRALLISWLREGKIYPEIVRLFWEKLKIKTSVDALSNFYQRNLEAILGKPKPSPFADGLGVAITCRRVGEMKLEIYPLSPAGDDESASENITETSVRAGRLEIVAAGTSPGEIRLIVRPLPELPADP